MEMFPTSQELTQGILLPTADNEDACLASRRQIHIISVQTRKAGFLKKHQPVS
jgi:hypothetical protein